MNAKRVLAVAHKEWREILRDRLFFALAFVVPPALMLIFGYGLSLDAWRRCRSRWWTTTGRR